MTRRIVQQNWLALCVLATYAGFMAPACHVGELVASKDPDPPGDDTRPPDSADQDPDVVATHLAFSSQPEDVTAGDVMPTVRIEARDDDGEPVTDFTGTVRVSIASGPDGASLGGKVERAAADGVVEFEGLVIQRAWADYALSVAANELKDAVSESFAVEPAGAGAIEVVSGDDQVDSVAGTLPERYVVHITDAFDNAVPGVAVTWDVVRGEGSIAADQTRTDDDGRVSARYTLGTIAGDQIVVAAVVGRSEVVATFVSRATPGQPVAFVVTEQPSNTASGDVITPPVVARVVDQFGNTATQVEQPVAIGLAPFTGTPLARLSGTLSRTPVSGFVVFDDLSINLPGVGYRLRLRMESLSRDSNAFNVF
jgi:hypothetical protein